MNSDHPGVPGASLTLGAFLAGAFLGAVLVLMVAEQTNWLSQRSAAIALRCADKCETAAEACVIARDAAKGMK